MKIIKMIANDNIKIVFMRIPQHERKFFNCSKEYLVEVSSRTSKTFKRLETSDREKAEKWFEKEVLKIKV